jgi:uncharacterized protein (TIGR02117 family)
MRLLRLQVRARGFRGSGLIRRFARLVLFLAALPALYLVAAIAGAAIPVGAGDAATGTLEVLLIQGPIHTDFLLPLDDETKTVFGFLRDTGFDLDHPGADYLLMGWGGRTFYTTTPTWREVQARAIWRSVRGDASVMRVDLAGPVPATVPVHRLQLDDATYARLLAAIRGSFAAGVPIKGYGDYDMFFPASGRFDLGHTCNAWVGTMLREAGLRFGAWTPLPWSVSLSWWLYHG